MKKTTRYKTAFLAFLSRSGSTFLSQLLNQYTSITVTPEANLVNRYLSLEKTKLNNKRILDCYLDLIYADDKFCAWGVNRKELKETLATKDFPIDFHTVFNHIIDALPKKKNSSVIIYKSPFVAQLPEIIKEFPTSKIIVIYRDIRAIYNSQCNTINTENNKLMKENPIQSSVRYNLLGKLLSKYRSHENILAIKYEDLIDNPDQEIETALSFLEIDNREKNVLTNYVENLSVNQRKIHPNINRPPQKKRVYAWRNELDYTSIHILQKYTHNTLKLFGYPLDKPNVLSWRERITFLSIHLRYIFKLRGKYQLLKRYRRLYKN